MPGNTAGLANRPRPASPGTKQPCPRVMRQDLSFSKKQRDFMPRCFSFRSLSSAIMLSCRKPIKAGPIFISCARCSYPVYTHISYSQEPDGWYKLQQGRIFLRPADELRNVVLFFLLLDDLRSMICTFSISSACSFS